MSAAACCCLLLPATACCCLQLPAAACCCLLLPAAACYPARILLEIESNPIHQMLTSLLDLAKNKATAAAGCQNVPLATPKHHGPEGRNDLQINRKNACYPARILLEIESNPIHQMLTSLLDLVKNKATAAAGCQNVPLATPKHHGPEGRNDLQINRKNKFPGGRNVPSEILLEILSPL